MCSDTYYSCLLDQSAESQGGCMVMDIVFPVFLDGLPRGADCPFPELRHVLPHVLPLPQLALQEKEQ